MAFTLDIALAGEESIERALTSIGGKLKKAEDEAARLSIAAEKAIQAVGTDYAKAAAKANAATGTLNTGLEAESKLLQKTWQETQRYNNVLKDQQKLQHLVHKSSKDYSTALEQQIMQMTHAGMRTAYLREAEMKLAEQHRKLQAEASLFNTTMAQTVRGMEAQLKAAKATEEADRKRTQRVKDLTAELKHLSTQEGKDALLLEHKIKLAKEAALAETKRKERIGALRSELRYLASEEGKKAESLALQVKRSKDAAVAEEQRKNRLKDLRAELRQLSTEEAKKVASLELAIKRQKELATADERRKNKLKDLRAEIRFLNSEAGKKTAAEELTLKRTKELATQEQRRANRLKDLRAELRYLKSEQGVLASELELSVKRQKELATEEQRRKNRIKDLRAELKHLNSDEGKRALSIERQIKRQKELAGQEDARRNRIKDLRAELAYLNSAEGKRGAVLEQQLRGQRELVVEEEKRRQTLQKLRAELDYLKTEEGKRQELMKAEIALNRQLIQEQVKQSSELAKARAARDQYSSATQRNIELARLELAEKKKADKAWAEEQLGIKKTTVAVNDHSDSIRKLKAEIQFLQTAQGKEFMELERQKRQLKQTRDELLKAGTATDRFKRSVRELTAAVNLSNQATAGFRAGLAGIGTSFGMFTSSTILFASAVYGVGSALKSSIQAGTEFESQMDRVNAIMDASGANTVRLTEEVRSLAENTVFTAREVSDGLMYLGMAGLKTEDALTALEPSLRLASIGMLDMGTTADIVTNIMVGMGLEAGQISEIVDDMATAITNSNMDVRQLGNAMSYVAPLAREADISLQEITASLEVLHNTGIKASRAGTAMRTSMLSLLAPTAEAMEVLQRYGIQVDDNSGRMRNWTELLTEMAGAQMTLSDIEAIVGKRQAAGLKAMIDSAKATDAAAEKAKKLGIEVGKSASELKVLTQQLHENAGAAKVMQSIMEDNLKGDWLKLQAAIEEKYLEFYDMNKEELRYLVQAATDFVKSLDVEDINAQFRTMAGWIAEIVQLLAAAKAGMFALGAVNMMGTAAGAAMSYGALGAEWVRGRKAARNNTLYSDMKQRTDNRMLSGMIMSGAESRKYTQTIPGALATTANIASSVTPFGAGRTLLAKTLQYGLQGAAVGGAGYGVYNMMNSGGDYMERNFGLGAEGVDYAMENRLSRYRDMGSEQLIAEYNSIQGALETTATAYAMAQEELHKHLALENLEEADKVRSTMEQQTRQAEELAKALQAAGIAKDESGLFGSQAEAEMALASAGAAYLNAQTMYQQLSQRFAGGDKAVTPEVLEASYKSTAVWAERVAELAGTVNVYKSQTLKYEQALKSANEDTANKAKEVKDSYYAQKAELLGQVNLQDKLSAVRAERIQLEKEYLGEEQKGLSNTNNAKERALKLLQQEERIKGQINQQNDRADKNQDRANKQAAQALEQTMKRKEALASQYDSIEYINDAYERGILLLDDEEYQRDLAIRQQERQILLAEEKLAAELDSVDKTEESVAAREKQVATEKEILRLLGRQKVELSEAVRFAQQQVSSLESMYSTIESETIGLLERGFKDTESYFDSIVGSFKRMLAELAYQAAIKPIMIQMVASAGTMMGMGTAAKTWAGEQGVSVGGGMGNLLDMGKSAWNFWKGGGQADVTWFNDFSKSSIGQGLGLSSISGVTSGAGYSAFAGAMPNTAGYLGMGTTTATSGLQGLGGTATSTAGSAVMGQGASMLSQGMSYSPWGMVGGLLGGAMGIQGSGNMLIDGALTTGGSVLGATAGVALASSLAGAGGAAAGAKVGSIAGPIGAALGAIAGLALGGLFGGDKSYRMRGSIANYSETGQGSMRSYAHETIEKESAFGVTQIHINKYGDEKKWQPFLDSLVSLDNHVASALTAEETERVQESLIGWRRGGNRGDQGRISGDFYNERMTRVYKAADNSQYEQMFSAGYGFGMGHNEYAMAFTAIKTLSNNMEVTYADMLALRTTIYDEFKIGSEKVGEALNRLVGDFGVVKASIDLLGMTLSGTVAQQLGSSAGIIEKMGGAENLTAGVDAFYNTFFTDEERTALYFKNLTEQLSEMNLQLPETAQGFKDLALSSDLATEAGQKQFTDLLKFSDMAGAYYEAIATWQAQLESLFGTLALRAPKDTELDAWLQKLKTGQMTMTEIAEAIEAIVRANSIELSEDQQTALFDATTQVLDGYNYTIELLEEEHNLRLENIQAQEAFLKSVRDIANSLVLSGLSPLTPQERLTEARQQYETIVSELEAGDMRNAGKLQGASQAYLTEASNVYASSGSYLNIFGEVMSKLAELEAQYTSADTVEERTQASIDQWIAAQENAQVVFEQQLLLAAEGINAQMTLIDIVRNLPVELGQVIMALVGSDQVDLGLPDYDILPDGSHATGLNYVPYDGYKAILHKGEQVVPANKIRREQNVSSEMVAELRQLRTEVATLRTEMAQHTGEIVAGQHSAAGMSAEKIVQGAEKVAKKSGASKEVRMR